MSFADNAFNQAMQGAHFEAERVMGESFRYLGVDYLAFEIDQLSETDQQMLGGRYQNVSMLIHVREALFIQSAVAKGKIIRARETDLRISEIDNDGDGSRVLLCIGVGIKV